MFVYNLHQVNRVQEDFNFSRDAVIVKASKEPDRHLLTPDAAHLSFFFFSIHVECSSSCDRSSDE